MNIQGYTLTEIVLVIAILVVITGVSVPVYGNFINLNSIESDKNKILQNIRYAQSRAKSGLYGRDYGVHFSTTSYTLYSGDTFSSRDVDKDENFEIMGDLKLLNLKDINFETKTGKPATTGTLILTNTNNNTTSSIKINSEGLIQ